MDTLTNSRFHPTTKNLPMPNFMKSTKAIEAWRDVSKKIDNGIYSLHQRQCPLCDSHNYLKIASVERHNFRLPTVLCIKCGMVYSNPVLSSDALQHFYGNTYRNLYDGTQDASRILSSDDSMKRAIRFQNWMRKNLLNSNICRDSDLIVEVGCGSGRHIRILRDRGYFAIGIDLDESYMAAGREMELDLRTGNIHNVKLPQKPRIIFYHHVFEHIPNAKQELDNVWHTLEDQGYLVISVPGIRYFGKVYNHDFIKYLQIAHTQHYSLHTLSRLMIESGFKLVCGNETIRAVFQKTEPLLSTKKNNLSNIVGSAEYHSIRWLIDYEESVFREMSA